LQEAIFAFERTTGVVETITSESGSKSGQLAKALAGGKKIVVCTLQTFPFALKAVQELAATTGKKFAVIADEAHSSQTGAAASKLKQVLAAEGVEEEIGKEDILAAQMSAKAGSAGISFVAFTATPKAKTLELFGRPPNPDAPTGPGSQRSLLILLDAVDTGTLSLASVGNGFSDLRLRRDEVDLLFCKSEVTETEALIPATAFGISIGIQDNGRFRKLIDAGHTPATRRRNPRTGLENIYMTPADLAAFHRRFVTVPSLAGETGRTIFEIRADLKRAGVAVLAPEEQDFGRLFLREAVEAALSPKADRRT
jgi:hypothetical protein